jgi:hypothetical protein
VWWLLLLIPIVWLLLQTIVGAGLRADTTGRLYLRQLLKKAGILHLVPEECVRELTTIACKIAEMHAFGRGSMEMKAELVKVLQGTAAVIFKSAAFFISRASLTLTHLQPSALVSRKKVRASQSLSVCAKFAC